MRLTSNLCLSKPPRISLETKRIDTRGLLKIFGTMPHFSKETNEGFFVYNWGTVVSESYRA